ncbi:hypothetical protein CRE_19457 [Caenorhabditis remanei]|uniref:ribonuclease H n=1 Tax=Caenorhabditis remanei TaxID=31234 RepID=E3NA31_CAERE|nr:hypothetical protein CRE_19457 [Caenorhabditis remanei]
MSNSKHAVINIDGACINQGLSNAKAGYGVHWGENHQNNLSGRVVGDQDNNRGELTGANQALKQVNTTYYPIDFHLESVKPQAASQGYTHVTLRSDSTYVRDAIAGASGFQSASPANRDLMQSIHDLSKGGRMTVHYEHVSGHSGDAGNDAAHRLATEGAKK